VQAPDASTGNDTAGPVVAQLFRSV
jgi:hypothetical protein